MSMDREAPTVTATTDKWQRERVDQREGDVVLVAKENTLRGQCPLGRVSERIWRTRTQLSGPDSGVLDFKTNHNLCLFKSAA